MFSPTYFSDDEFNHIIMSAQSLAMNVYDLECLLELFVHQQNMSALIVATAACNFIAANDIDCSNGLSEAIINRIESIDCFCTCCGDAATTTEHDDGIGSYEIGDLVEYQSIIYHSTDCCDASPSSKPTLE